MAGARFDDVVARRPDLRMPFPRNFGSRLTGQTVLALTRRAKYLLAGLSSHETLLMHLGMSGSFRVGPGDDGRRRRMPAAVTTTSSSTCRQAPSSPSTIRGDLVSWTWCRQGSWRAIPPSVRSDPSRCQRSSTPGRWRGRAGERRRRSRSRCWINASSPVSAISMSSKRCTVPGCRRTGRRRRSPPRPGLPRPTAFRLAAAIKQVLIEAIDRVSKGGYRSSRFRVYDREGERCRRARCGGTIKRRTQAGRSTFYCPVCQR